MTGSQKLPEEPRSEALLGGLWATAVATHWQQEANCIGSDHPPKLPESPTNVRVKDANWSTAISLPPLLKALSGESAPQAFCAPPPVQQPAEQGT
jgi:hypothetical protein